MTFFNKITPFLIRTHSQWFLSFAVCFIGGIACYFGLPFEPNLNICIGVCAGLFAGVIILRRNIIARFAFGCVLFAGLGLTAAACRAHASAAPKLSEPVFQAEILGRVADVANKESRQKITLADVQFRNQAFVQTPRFITLSVPEKSLRIGDIVLVQANLFPPANMTDVGAYSGTRALWFEGVGATGWTTRIIRHISTNRNPPLNALRAGILNRIQQLLPPDTAGIVAALVLGEAGFITPTIYDQYRIAGIAHVLSVSGYHMALLSGLIFFIIRGFLSLIPAVALRLNTKKAAAVLALIITGLYLALSGFQVPAVRSFLMISIVFVGILWDRDTFSLKSLAIIALIVLMIKPELLITARFQLSFIAVLGLVSLYQSFMSRWHDIPRHTWMQKVLFVFGGALTASAIASVLTIPFVMYHFGTIATYSIVGNICTTFFFSVLIMPLLLLAMILMPLGGDAVAWHGAGYFLDVVSTMTEHIARFPYATLYTPAFGGGVLCLITAGIFGVCLARKHKLIWLIPISVGLCAAYFAPQPDIYVADRGQTIAVREPGGLRFIAHSGNSLTTDMLMRRAGQDIAYLGPARTAPRMIVLRNKKISFSPDTCRNADVAILSQSGGHHCPAPVFTADEVRASPLVIYLTPRPRGVWVNQTDAGRLWNK